MSGNPLTEPVYSWYEDAYNDFRSRYSPLITDLSKYFFQKQKELGLEEKEIFLSIGPGVGDIDVKVLPAHTHLRLYLAVEPNPKACELLKKTLQDEIPSLAHEVTNKTVDDWEGPQTPVDIIFASHVLYYCTKPKETIEKLLSWLKPEGLLITTMVDEPHRKRVPAKFFRDNGRVYCDPELLADLKEIGVDLVDEEKFCFKIDVKNKTHNLANFMLHRACEEQEVKELETYMEKKFELGYMMENTTLRVIRKK